MVPTPSFASCEEVLPYLCRNWHLLTLTEFTNACAWGLDPGFVQRDQITHFIRSLPHMQRNQLPQEQDCPICFHPYNTHPSSDIPAVRLCCGHIVGADCLFEWLKDQSSCPQCHIEVFSKVPPQQHLSSLRHAQVLRGLLESGRKFLAEIRSGSGSLYVEGFGPFRNWAFARPGRNHGSLVARINARAHIARWDAFNSPTSAGL